MHKIVLLLLACLHPVYSQAESGNYTAVVAEYHCLGDTKLNTNLYAQWILDAVKNYSADIIIFPESSLNVRIEDGSVVPNPEDRIIPYKNKTYDKCDPMFVISEAAARNGIYVVINLFEHEKCDNTVSCPEKARFVYNTNVVFDRKGTVIARYRKYNIYDEKVNKPSKAELSTFTTDFGVTFGMFTCFDILFKTPAIDLVREKNVRNIIFPSWWYGELPFLTAKQVQDGWSYSMNVNLLASGANEPEKGTTGSGIYIARKSKISVMYEYAGASMVYGKVPVKTTLDNCFMASLTNDLPRKSVGLKLLEDPSIPQSRGRDLDANSGNFSDKICHNEFCCNFNLKYSLVRNSSEGYTYRAVAFQGKRRFGSNFTHDVAYCAVVLCTDGNCAKKPRNGNYPLQFEEIKIDADFKRKETLQMPTTLIWKDDPKGLELLNTMPYEFFSYESTDITGTDMVNVSLRLKTRGVKNLITFGIFGRKFD